MNQETLTQILASDQKLQLTSKQKAQFQAFYQLLVAWNQKMNLTAITDESEVYLKHFYDSLTLGRYADLSQPLTVADIGGGAGFPSIPLKIAYPNLRITVVDSLNKRMTFIQAVKEELGLGGIETVHARAEDFGRDPKNRDHFDIVTARAVARMTVLSEYCLPLVKKGGTFWALKGSQGADELTRAETAIKTLGGKVIQNHEFNLPEDGGERHIIQIEKRKETPKKYPRKAGVPQKKPLGE
ncbi:MAG: 16S rRNA (guanine(527)-N(7))-methyltransferase RsmG [Aerococcus sp.]|nr:16S rRNA (guanine(527)-N(7))-methyltransferase RsmG [Aerococcus sp.]